jgi:hypothetical protein
MPWLTHYAAALRSMSWRETVVIDFHKVKTGIRLYLHLRGYVQSAAVDEAVAEFEHRFEPMLDQELWKMARL